MNRLRPYTKEHAFNVLKNLKEEYNSIMNNKHYDYENQLKQLKAIINLYEATILTKYPVDNKNTKDS